MSLLYVTEYAGIGFTQVGGAFTAVPIEPPLADYTVVFGSASPVFQPSTILVRLACDAVCSVLIGLSPVASTTNGRLAANQTEYRGVPAKGFQVSVVSNV
jgi:hypothetical protein